MVCIQVKQYNLEQDCHCIYFRSTDCKGYNSNYTCLHTILQCMICWVWSSSPKKIYWATKQYTYRLPNGTL